MAQAPAASSPVRLNPLERRATAGLAGIFGLRMLGMFIILPVFALYAEHLPGGDNRLLIGVALGTYGLTQALLQIPFGWLSDRWGRKRVIYLGLTLFALGSFLAAVATDLPWIIAGRTLQGAGAISAAVIALLADLTRDSVRTKAMAMVGMTIGLTFGLSLIAGPGLSRWIGVPGIFALTGLLALAAMLVVRTIVPEPIAGTRNDDRQVRGQEFATVLRDGSLQRLNFGIFALHAALMSLFVQVPFALRDNGLAPEHHWQVYLGVLVGSFVLIFPAFTQADRADRGKPIFIGAVAVLLLGQTLLALQLSSLHGLIAALLIFFAGFNLLEAKLPAMVSRFAPPEVKGTAIGVYSGVQFLGMFVGGAVGGWLAEHVAPAAVFWFGAALTLAWLALSVSMPSHPAYNTQSFVKPMGES
ncbi:MAG: MFS transporter [Betaproteobacteria bacterium]|nr:MFS transporter [Betaproteobacteria bacterium]